MKTFNNYTTVLTALQQIAPEAHIAGGAVRDTILQRQIRDTDVFMRDEHVEEAAPPLLTLIETSKVNDPHFTAPSIEIESATGTSQEVIDALKTVRAAGYRVSRRSPKHPKHNKDRVGPSFVAEFADGTVTRMSTFTSLEKLDWARGERLSQAAYQSRRQTRETPPAIIAMRFEQDGVVLGTRP